MLHIISSDYSGAVSEEDLDLHLEQGFRDSEEDEEIWMWLKSSSIAMETDTS